MRAESVRRRPLQGMELFLVAGGKVSPGDAPIPALRSINPTFKQFRSVQWREAVQNANNDKNAGRTSAQARKESEWF